MNFHLEFPVAPFTSKMNYSHSFLFFGSCFAENIGFEMEKAKFKTTINPFGILYNPASISKAIRRCVNKKNLNEIDLFLANECWNSWEHHSCFSQIDKNKTLENINKKIASADINKIDWLFITFGSAFVYRLKSTHEIVGNCHKLPQKDFEKKRLSTKEIIEDYNLLIQELKAKNENLKIVFTVSPVRYIRDGVIENNLSKSTLNLAVHELVKQNSNVFHFPAYELIIDDLRDYRFFESDLVHPNEQAILYVFNKWKEASFDAETINLFERITEITTASNHRPLHNGTESHKKFNSAFLEKCILLQNKYPQLNFSKEELIFKA